MARMVSTAAVQRSFDRSFGLYRDLLAALDEDGLRSRLPGLKSNTIGAQLWCVIGARESYGRVPQQRACSPGSHG